MGEMSGKTVLITGATSGIGRVTARELARKGASVHLVGRDKGRCDQAVEATRREAGNADVHAFVADLSRLDEVRRLADEALGRLDRIDVLVNNAGAIYGQRSVTADGFERTFALNHLAYFLLTDRLLDRLKASAPARVVVVASDAHRGVRGLDWDDLQSEKSYGAWRAYCRSKLANILFARELARRLEGSGVTANALHPGFVSTNFFSNLGAVGKALALFTPLVARSPAKGAETSIHLASSPEVEGVTGRYFSDCKPVEPTKAAQDDQAARRLWEVSERLTGVESPGAD